MKTATLCPVRSQSYFHFKVEAYCDVRKATAALCLPRFQCYSHFRVKAYYNVRKATNEKESYNLKLNEFSGSKILYHEPPTNSKESYYSILAIKRHNSQWNHFSSITRTSAGEFYKNITKFQIIRFFNHRSKIIRWESPLKTLEFYPMSKWTSTEIQVRIKLRKMATVVSDSA